MIQGVTDTCQSPKRSQRIASFAHFRTTGFWHDHRFFFCVRVFFTLNIEEGVETTTKKTEKNAFTHQPQLLQVVINLAAGYTKSPDLSLKELPFPKQHFYCKLFVRFLGNISSQNKFCSTQNLGSLRRHALVR